MTELNSTENKQEWDFQKSAFQKSCTYKFGLSSIMWLITGVLEILLGIDFLILFLQRAAYEDTALSLVSIIYILVMVLLGCISIAVFRRNITLKKDIANCVKSDMYKLILLLAASLFTFVVYLQIEPIINSNRIIDPTYTKIPTLFGYFLRHEIYGVYNTQGFMYGEIGGIVTYRFISVLLILTCVMVAAFTDILNIENVVKNKVYFLEKHNTVKTNKNFTLLALSIAVMILVVVYAVISIAYFTIVL